MSAISDITEAWAGHSGLEVETFLKNQIGAAVAAAGGKFGFVEMTGTDLKFYEDADHTDTPLAVISLGGDVYNIDIQNDAGQVFYILADETEKLITISASTTVSPFGSTERTPFPEAYSYVVSVNTGNGYVPRITGNIDAGGESTFDIRPYIATGDNYIRIAVTGLTSGQVKTIVLTGTLTTLTMSCNHAWQNVWNQNNAYVISGIRFAGSIQKVLHVAINGVEQTPVNYGPNQSYTTSSTTYTLPSTAFPATSNNGVHEITLWMTAGSVSTPVITYHIMCAKENNTTPMVAINDITPLAVNFTSDTIFGYAVYNADRVVFNLNATIGGQNYRVTPQGGVPVADRVEGQRYTFAYSLEIDTGVNTAVLGTLTAEASSFNGSTVGVVDSRTTNLDNTYSYIATPGALFYLNAATRDNGATNYQDIVNEMGASQDGNFAASYSAVWSGFSWTNDGWSFDPAGNRALVIPAGATLTVTDFKPLSLLPSYQNGLTIEMMIQCASPSEYSTPVFSIYSSDNGLLIYPTKISILGTAERSEVLQSVNLSENRMTHIVVTFTKNYEGVNSRNLVSVFINGISNVNFAFDGSSSFSTAPLVIGQPNTDAYLYKMRVYGMALESRAVFNNFLNCVIDGIDYNRREQYEKNDIIDGGAIGYEACKAAGYNTMVVIMDDDSHQIPSYNNQASYDGCTLRFEYADHPEWNVTVANVSIDGQGTTSKQYFRWNLRAKTGNGTVWTYGDETTETGKEGYFAGRGKVRVDRITAKKNYASSMQGHKMGMTGLYNDLFKQLGLGEELPNPNSQVAVYQYPFVGFRYNATNATYEFIGLYTAGPDKGSKVTFGYKSSFDYLLSLEGPNHAPRGTRFLTPWVNVVYDYQDETLKYGGEEGWDCDYVGAGLSSDKAADASAIQALYESEWKPAYDIVYHCSPFIAALSATGYASLAAINADITNFLTGSTGGVSNLLLSFYDSNYDLIFYRNSTGKFEYLTAAEGKSTFNIRTYLGLTGNPTTAQIISARAAKFKAQMGNYWSLNQTLFHYCYCVLFGATDNFAKNSYPFKFRQFSDSGAGNRWGWREDDLDTVLMTDNNGRNTKSYSVEHGDTSGDGVELFQGGNSALWVLIRDNYQTEIRQMMVSIANAAAALATTLGIQGDGLHNSLFNLVSYYCWEFSAKYFSATLYESDRRWSYLEPWLINASAVYNNVPPLTQALGDQYQAERLWVERRIAYVFSKYRVGAFSGENTGYHAIAFTLAQSFTFNIVPAIDLYPVISLANSGDSQGTRTEAGDPVQISITGDGQTTNYIHGGDWLASLGDVSRMVLTSRGASSDIEFSLNVMRLQTLKVGDATASNVLFNATSLAVKSPTITEIDARNTTTVRNSVDLLECPRLRRALFSGSGATGLLLPVGAKLTEVSFPTSAATVFMHSLPFIDESDITLPPYANIVNLCINNCPNINPLALVEDIVETPNNRLQYVTITWRDPLVATQEEIDTLFTLTNKSGYVDYQDGSVVIVNGYPWVEGPLTSSERIPGSTYMAIENAFPKIELDFDLTKVYLDFEDPNVETIALANWDTDHSNEITLNEARAVTTLGTLFRVKTNITSFNELQLFTGLTQINGSNNSNGAFQGCSGLTTIRLPKTVKTIGNYAFAGCTSLASINLDKVTQINDRGFYNTSGLQIELNCPELATLSGGNQFESSGITKIVSLGRITSIGAGTAWNIGAFAPCPNLTEVTLPDTLTSIGHYAFSCDTTITNMVLSSRLQSIGNNAFRRIPAPMELPQSITSIGTETFRECTGIEEVNLPNLTSINYAAFMSCTGLRRITSLGRLTTLTSAQNNGTFQGCTALTEINWPDTMTSIGVAAFRDCTALPEVVFPPQITTIGAQAFYNDYSAVFRNFENITSIGQEAFRNCFPSDGNYEIYLRDITSIGYGAFYNAKIKKVTFGPNLLIVTGANTAGCFAADDGHVSRNTLEEVVFEGNVREIGADCFRRRNTLRTINLPNSISVIGAYALSGTGITNVINLPNLNSLGQGAFSWSYITKIENLGRITNLQSETIRSCPSLTEVTLPATLTAINDAFNFNDCPVLRKLTLLSTSVPTLGGNCMNTNFGVYEILVSPTILKGYYIATNWVKFTYRVFPYSGNDPNAIVKGVSFRRNNSNWQTTTISNTDYSVTFCIEVDPYHQITFNGGFVYDGTDGHEIFLWLNENYGYVGYYNTSPSPRTVTINNANVKYVRMTLKTSELANCYIHDDTDNVYLWRGSDVTTIYE